MIYCKPNALSFAIRAALGMYTPAIGAIKTLNGEIHAFFI